MLRLRFEEDLTQAEIGEIIGVSQMQVSRLIRQAVARLRLAARTDPSARSSRLTAGADRVPQLAPQPVAQQREPDGRRDRGQQPAVVVVGGSISSKTMHAAARASRRRR